MESLVLYPRFLCDTSSLMHIYFHSMLLLCGRVERIVAVFHFKNNIKR